MWLAVEMTATCLCCAKGQNSRTEKSCGRELCVIVGFSPERDFLLILTGSVYIEIRNCTCFIFTCQKLRGNRAFVRRKPSTFCYFHKFLCQLCYQLPLRKMKVTLFFISFVVSHPPRYLEAHFSQI